MLLLLFIFFYMLTYQSSITHRLTVSTAHEQHVSTLNTSFVQLTFLAVSGRYI